MKITRRQLKKLIKEHIESGYETKLSNILVSGDTDQAWELLLMLHEEISIQKLAEAIWERGAELYDERKRLAKLSWNNEADDAISDQAIAANHIYRQFPRTVRKFMGHTQRQILTAPMKIPWNYHPIRGGSLDKQSMIAGIAAGINERLSKETGNV